MPKFGSTSKRKLDSCHKELRRLFREVVKTYDCSVIEGYRGQERQNQLYNENKSRVKFPHGKHNKTPSIAVDVAPYIKDKISWNRFHCIHFAGYVQRVAEELGIKIRWGGNWDMDDEIMTDQKFQDLVHFELVL